DGRGGRRHLQLLRPPLRRLPRGHAPQPPDRLRRRARLMSPTAFTSKGATVRKRWAGLATTIAVLSSLLALNGAIDSAKADSASGRTMGQSDAGYRQYWDPILQKLDKSGGGDGDVLSDQSGWYSVDLGNWHIIGLNWACSPNPGAGSGSGCGATDPQGVWLAGDLQKATAAHQHIIAMWHGARFFSQNDNATPTVTTDDPGPAK